MFQVQVKFGDEYVTDLVGEFDECKDHLLEVTVGGMLAKMTRYTEEIHLVVVLKTKVRHFPLEQEEEAWKYARRYSGEMHYA
jgi:hypothetical protein